MQTIKKKYSKLGEVERQQILIPEGFIFQEIYPNRRSIYFFPNHLNYSALITPNINYIGLTKNYQIRNADSILQPFVYDPSEDILKLNSNLQNRFFMGLNMMNIDPIFLQGDVGLPYFWDSRRGFETSRQFSITYPILPRNISNNHKAMLLGFFGKKLLEEAGKYEFSTINIRLALASLFSKVFKDDRTAKTWIQNLHGQIKELSYADILRFLKVYIDIFQNREQNVLNSLCGSLTTNVNLASLEERLETDIVKEWNPYLPISGNLNAIKIIVPGNSTILRGKLSEFSATLTLIDLVNRTSNLTEVSFENLSLWIEERKLHFRRHGQSFSFSPLRKLIWGLEKQSPLLEKMNFSGIRLNGEEIGDEILEYLNSTRFTNLRYLDLSFTGATGSHIGSSLSFLSYFTRLKNLILDFNPLSLRAVNDLITVAQALPELNVSIQDNTTFVQLPKNADKRITLTLDLQEIFNPLDNDYEGYEDETSRNSGNSSSNSGSESDEDSLKSDYDSDSGSYYASESDGDS